MRFAPALLATLSGCAQMLGLENTKFDQKDAMIDAPNVCDGAPACTASSGRSVCGQLVQTGADAGTALRLAAPTGQSCAALGSNEGPCALTVFGQAMPGYFAASTTGRITGEIDDCGRFVVLDLDQNADDVAVVITGDNVKQTASLVIDRAMMVGTDKNVILPVVASTTATSWGMQLDAGTPPDVTSSYLVSYVNTMDLPAPGIELRVNGAAVGDPPTLPWGAYFSGTAPFNSLDPTPTATQDTGSALVVPPSGSFVLGGFKVGRNCEPLTVQAVAAALIHVTLRC